MPKRGSNRNLLFEETKIKNDIDRCLETAAAKYEVSRVI